MGLDPNKVVETALTLLNEVGIDGLTTRRLAQELGVQGPALYWHFKNKQALIDHMVAAMLSPPFPVSTSEDWAVSLSNSARRARRIILSYRDGARMVASSLPVDVRDHDLGMNFLQDAGFTADEAFYIFLLLSRFVVGWTLSEQSLSSRTEKPPPGFDPEAAFEFGLQSVLTGLRQRVLDVPARRTEVSAA